MKICVSYSHQGFDALVTDGIVRAIQKGPTTAAVWYDQRLEPGREWNSEIQREFREADAFLVVASDRYFETDYVRQFELPLILERFQRKEVLLFWIPLDHDAIAKSSLGNQLAQAQAFDFNAKWSGKELSEFFDDAALRMKLALSRRAAERGAEPVTPVALQAPTEAQMFDAYLRGIEYQVRYLTRSRSRDGDYWFPFDRLYVTLNADYRPLGDREAGKQLLAEEVAARTGVKEDLEKVTARVLAADVEARPLAEPLDSSDTSRDSLERIFRMERFLVVRGDPGSGKTVLCCFLARELAHAMQNHRRSDYARAARPAVFLGPARTPILIPIRDFAAWCRSHASARSLLDFIGKRKHIEIKGIDETHVHDFLRRRLERGEAVVLLDGLDEVQIMERGMIVAAIEAFAERFIVPHSSPETPERAGGSQILITSRIAGYDLQPMTLPLFRHYVIRSFDDEAKEKFCRHWAEIRFPGNTRAAVELRRYVLQDASPAIQQLASNPLLLGTLCDLAASFLSAGKLDEPRPLPRSRAALYHQAIDAMGRRWRKAVAEDGASSSNRDTLAALLQADTLFAMLAAIAREMYESRLDDTSANFTTIITADRFSRIVQDFVVRRVSGKPLFQYELDEAIALQSDLIELLRTQVGVFTERAPDLFGFLHLTFQEYLAGYDLCLDEGGGWKSAERVADEIATRASDPTWREPLLLAFGHLGQLREARDEDAPSLEAVIHALESRFAVDNTISADDAAIFLTDLWLELPDEQLNAPVASELVTSLGRLYAQWGGDNRFSRPREHLASTLAALRRRFLRPGESAAETVVDEWLAHLMKTDHGLTAPLAHLVRERGWYTECVMDALVEQLKWDDGAWHWPMHAALRETCLEQIFAVPIASKLDEPAGGDVDAHRARLNYEAAVGTWQALRMRESERLKPVLPYAPRICGFLRTHAAARTRFEQDAAARRVIAALHGGFQDLQAPRLLQEYRDLASLLQKASDRRSQVIEASPEVFLPRWGNDDIVYAIAVYLDTQQGGLGQYRKVAPRLSADWIVRDACAPIANVVQAWLGSDRPVSSLRDELSSLALDRGDAAAEAALALVLLGEDIDRLESRHKERFRWLLERTLDDLRDPVLRATTVKSLSIWNALDMWLPTLDDADAAAVFRFVVETLVDAGGLPVEPVLHCARGRLLDDAYRAEQWAWAFAGGSGDDSAYEFKTVLENIGLGETMQDVIRMVASITFAANARLMPFRRLSRVPWGMGEHGGAPTITFFNALDQLAHVAQQFQGGLDFELLKKCMGTWVGDDVETLVLAFLRGDFALPEDAREGADTKTAGRVELPAADRALWLARSAERTGGERGEELFAEALQYATHVRDVEWRTEFLRRTQIVARRSERALRAHGALADTLPTPILRASAKGTLASLFVSDGAPAPRPAPDDWIAITVFAACRAALWSPEGVTDDDELWNEIAKAATSPSAARAVGAFVERAGAYGLHLTAAAPEALEALADADSEECSVALQRLLPLIRHHALDEVQRLREWSLMPGGSTGRALLSCHAALLLAERSRTLEEPWIDKLVDLAVGNDDLSRARARLVLGGAELDVERTWRDYQLSAQGAKVFLRIAEQDRLRRDLPIAHSLGGDIGSAWSIDAPDALRDCLRIIEDDDVRGRALNETMLNGGARWTPECLHVVEEWLRRHPDQWNERWLAWFCMLIRLQKDELPASLTQTVHSLALRFTSRVTFIFKDDSYKNVVEACAEAIRENPVATVVDANRRFAAFIRTLDAAAETWLNDCADAGDGFFQYLSDSPETRGQFGVPYAEDEAFVNLMLDWLDDTLTNWSQTRGDALSFASEQRTNLATALTVVTSVVTADWPDRFATRIVRKDPPTQLAELLEEAALHHPRHLARQSALTLLSRAPRLPVARVARLFDYAVHDDALVRTRALALLPWFRNLQTEAFVQETLKGFETDQRPSAKLAKAELLTSLVLGARVRDAQMRRLIIRSVEKASRDASNGRALAYLAGTGTTNDHRTVEVIGRLDVELQALAAKVATVSVQR